MQWPGTIFRYLPLLGMACYSNAGADVVPFATPTWQAVAAINTARAHFAAGVVEHKIFIYGGQDSNGNNLKSTEVLDLADPSAWTYAAESSNERAEFVGEASGATLNGKFYVFGTYGGEARKSGKNFVEEYSPASDAWSSKTSMLTNRFSTIAAGYDNEIFVFGGEYAQNEDSKQNFYKVVEAYNPSSDSWRKVGNMPASRLQPGLGVVGDKAYLFGGALISSWKAYKNVYAYNFATKKWISSGLTALPTPRIFSFGHAAPVLNDKIYLIGGATVDKKPNVIASDKVEIYDPLSNTWQRGPSLPQPSLWGVAVVADNEIYAIGGQTTQNETTISANVWKLGDAWKATLTTQEICDLDADGKNTSTDAKLFSNACKAGTAYWPCDLNSDGQFSAKDTATYKVQWKVAKTTCE